MIFLQLWAISTSNDFKIHSLLTEKRVGLLVTRTLGHSVVLHIHVGLGKRVVPRLHESCLPTLSGHGARVHATSGGGTTLLPSPVQTFIHTSYYPGIIPTLLSLYHHFVQTLLSLYPGHSLTKLRISFGQTVDRRKW